MICPRAMLECKLTGEDGNAFAIIGRVKRALRQANVEQADIDKFLSNLRDYGDNTIRYFRLTKFIRIRGNGFYVDLEPNRHTEIEALFEGEFYRAKDFVDRDAYLNYMSDDNLPVLPWQTKEKLSKIANEVYAEVINLQNTLGLS